MYAIHLTVCRLFTKQQSFNRRTLFLVLQVNLKMMQKGAILLMEG